MCVRARETEREGEAASIVARAYRRAASPSSSTASAAQPLRPAPAYRLLATAALIRIDWAFGWGGDDWAVGWGVRRAWDLDGTPL